MIDQKTLRAGERTQPKPPVAFVTEKAARDYASLEMRDRELSIVHSPHANNKAGDYFIDAPGSMIRSFEQLLFEGLGRDA